MKRWHTKQRVVVLTVVMCLPSSALAWCRLTTSQRAPGGTDCEPECIMPNATTGVKALYWDDRCGEMYLSSTHPSDDLMEADVRRILDASFTTWESVTCSGRALGLRVDVKQETTTCGVAHYETKGTNVQSLSFLDTWPNDYDQRAFALTTVWHAPSTGLIYDADIEMNERRGPFVECPMSGCINNTGVDLQNVLTHEIGHYFGMGHTKGTEPTMSACADGPEVKKRDLNSDDIEGICSAFATLPEQCNPAARGGRAENGCGAPKKEGCCALSIGSTQQGSETMLLLLGVLVGSVCWRQFRHTHHAA